MKRVVVRSMSKGSLTPVRKASIKKPARGRAVRKDEYIFGEKQKHDDTLVEKNSDICKVWNDDTLVEILIRVPVIKVFQFMRVSKQWRSIILQPWFRVYYLKHNPCGLLFRFADDSHPRFGYSTLREAEEAQPQEFSECLTVNKRIRSYSPPVSTQTINGFFCVIFDCIPLSRFFLFSVCEGEIMELPQPCFKSLPGCLFDYHFGFEPVEGVYKLLALPMPMNTQARSTKGRYILTINSRNTDILSWKRLPCGLRVGGKSLCVNGFLYWLYERSLVSFDLKEEEFCDLDPPEYNRYHFTSSWITQFKERLALFKWDSSIDELVLYSLDDKRGFAWTKHVTLLPSELQLKVRSDMFDEGQGYIMTKLYVRYLPKELGRRFMEFFLPIIVPVGNLPTGELLLVNATSEDPFTRVYSYNHTENSFRKLVVGKLPQSLLFRIHDFNGHVADIISCVGPNFNTCVFNSI